MQVLIDIVEQLVFLLSVEDDGGDVAPRSGVVLGPSPGGFGATGRPVHRSHGH